MMQRIDGAGPRSAVVIDPVEIPSGQLLSELEIRATYAQAVAQHRQNLPELTALLVAGIGDDVPDARADSDQAQTHPVDTGQPVFVDTTGRRRNRVRKAGLLLAPLLLGYAVVLGISLGTTADVPMVTWMATADQKPAPSQVKRKVVKKRGSQLSARLRKSGKRSVKVSPTTASKIVPANPRKAPPVTATPSAVPSPSPVPAPSATPTHGRPPTAPLGESKNRNST